MYFTEAVKRYAILAVLALALVLRTWAAFDHKTYFEDEALHVPTAIHLGQYGTTTSLNWFHPHMSHLILYGGIKIFGNTPYGWRSKNIILGTLIVAIVFLLARELFPGRRIPLLAATLVAVDPFHVYYSRTTFMEIPVSCFFLLFLLFLVKYLRTGRDFLIPAGLCLGLTMATKSYYPLGIVFALGVTGYLSWKQEGMSPAKWVYMGATLLVLPASVYLLSYIPWLSDGRSFWELFLLKQDAFRSLQSLTIADFSNQAYLNAGGRPWEWFLKPKICGSLIATYGPMGRYLLEINNPPIRMFTFPALACILVVAWRERSWKIALVPALFLVTYGLILAVRRPIFSYSALVLLPFAYMMVAFALDRLLVGLKNGGRVFAILVACIITWGVYLFPLTAVRQVPNWLYRPILSHTTFVSGSHSEAMP